MGGVVATDRHDFAAGQHRCQQPDITQLEAGLSGGDPGVQGIAGKDDYLGVGVEFTVLVEFALDHSELGILTHTEPGNSHDVSLPATLHG